MKSTGFAITCGARERVWQVIEVDHYSTYFRVASSIRNSRNVATYPSSTRVATEVTAQKTGLSAKVQELRSARPIWEINARDVEGTWNAAYDVWFSVERANSPEGRAELRGSTGSGERLQPA